MHIPDFRRRLLRWFRRHGRDLPWRRTRDPYHVIVSEFMLQQTQVSRVRDLLPAVSSSGYPIDRVARCTPVPDGDGRAGMGLGYYRRAANLHHLARQVVREHGRSDPLRSARSSRQLPGVGRYTAGAVASFAFERSAPAVDTNVARVIRRAFHPRGSSRALGPASLADRRASWSPAGKERVGVQSGNHGTRCTVCTARVASCSECPVRRRARRDSRTR